MLRIAKSHVESLNAAASAADLHDLVKQAIRLEFSTIPPYLTAMLSLKPGANREIWSSIHGVVIDEMLHMTIACNILNAIGHVAPPPLTDPGFLTAYPGPLPMAIGDELVVGLEPFSTDLMKRTFMEIEAPEKRVPIPGVAAAAIDVSTIGEFYKALGLALQRLGNGAFTGDPARQVVPTSWFGERAFPIRNVEDALRAIDLIVREGEGTPDTPLDPDGDFAHFYRFEELWRLKRIARDPDAPKGYSFSGPAIPFDPASVWNITANQKLADIDRDSLAGRRASQFAFVFTKLLRALEGTFGGAPKRFDAAMGLMFELKLAGQMLVTLPAVKGETPTGLNAGPTFELVHFPS